MSRLLCILLLVSTPVTAWAQKSSSPGLPLTGQVNNTHFNFTFGSTYDNNQITNWVRNRHNSPLHVTWPAACIYSLYGPIPPGGQDRNSYTVSSARIDKSATLTYGLAASKHPAEAYVDPERQETPEVLTSEVVIRSRESSVELQVVSTYLRAQGLLVLSVVRNNDFEFAMGSTEQTEAALKESGWTTPYPIDAIEGFKDFGRERNWPEELRPDFARFRVYRPPVLRSAAAVSLHAKTTIARPQLVLISKNQKLVGTGIISLHSRPEEGRLR